MSKTFFFLFQKLVLTNLPNHANPDFSPCLGIAMCKNVGHFFLNEFSVHECNPIKEISA